MTITAFVERCVYVIVTNSDNVIGGEGKTVQTPQEIFPPFLRDIAAVFPGYGKQGLRPLEY